MERELEDEFKQELIRTRDNIFASFMSFTDFTNHTILNRDLSVEDDTLSETIEMRVNKVLNLVALWDNLLAWISGGKVEITLSPTWMD